MSLTRVPQKFDAYGMQGGPSRPLAAALDHKAPLHTDLRWYLSMLYLDNKLKISLQVCVINKNLREHHNMSDSPGMHSCHFYCTPGVECISDSGLLPSNRACK